MLVTKQFIFLHVPKTGGSFVQTVLPEHLPVISHRFYAHIGHRFLPEEWRRLPACCVVRNPWDWYVSWYHYDVQKTGSRKPHKQQLAAFEGGRASFADATSRACRGEIDHDLAPLIKRERIDLYSAYVRNIAGSALDRPDFTVIRFEHLRRDLAGFLERQGCLTGELEEALLREPAVRASRHGPYRDYYDDDLRELVATRARWLCDRFGYAFSDAD